MEKYDWKITFAEGILLIILGIFAMALPKVTAFTFEILLGWILLIVGVIQIVAYFKQRKHTLDLIKSLLFIIAGGVLIAYPLGGIITLALVISLLLFCEGIAKAVVAYRLRIFKPSIWLFLSGLISITIAILVWTQWPSSAPWLLALFIGINLIFYGISQVIFALNLKPK